MNEECLSPGEDGAYGGNLSSHLRLPDLQVRSKVWIEAEGETAMCDFWAAIVEAVARTGSLAKAAEDLSVPLATLDRRLRESEERLGVRLVGRGRDVDGDICELTPEADEILRRYRRFSFGIRDLVDRRFEETFG
jgi:molybdate transport system regulatory protein